MEWMDWNGMDRSGEDLTDRMDPIVLVVQRQLRALRGMEGRRLRHGGTGIKGAPAAFKA